MSTLNFIKKIRFNYKWRSINRHNFTKIGEYMFDIRKVQVGNYTYGELNIKQFDSSSPKLVVGNFCSIGPNVVFLLDGEHRYNTLSTYPFKSRLFDDFVDTESKGDIIVEDDVWFGYGVTVLSGVRIGQGAVIGAGSVVVKDVEPYAVVGGVPAKLIASRFPKDIIDYLQTIDYSKVDKEMIKKYEENFYLDISQINCAELQKKYYWIPKKSN